ncbi:anti-sigma factor family protein [Pseudomonas knackmussii]|uniref:anti-sigma factor family protein n=1 Tax=Pseudomonas knackmussii TaxID=65741 RepID=UPI003BC7C93E
MLSCRELSELGSAIIEGELEQDTAQAVSCHLQDCPRCAAYIRQLQVTSQLLQGLDLTEPSVDTQAVVRKLLGGAE